MIPNQENEDWHYVTVKNTIYIIEKNSIKIS